ncbi:MAG: AI-2E family transporter [Solirubrobacteraceae bacterium]|nr:AI-2E family transporter [Solirubrobacteraceae bacterium]
MSRPVSEQNPPPAVSPDGAQPRPLLAVAAERSLQLLLIAAAVTAIVFVLVQLRLVVLPVIAALFVATVLAPVALWLRRHRWPAALAAVTTMTLAVAFLGLIVAAIVPAVVSEVGNVGGSARQGLDEVLTWLTRGPLDLDQQDINRAIDRGLEQLRESSGLIAGGVISGALLIGELIAGLLLVIVLLFFFLKDGDRIWSWLVGLAPAPRRADLDEVGRRAWSTLSGYIRGISIIAMIDAILIGIALALIGVPLVVPLMVLTFFGAFIPLVGAFVAGGVAALVALVSVGPFAALLVVVVITVIQQLEGDLLYPVIVGQSIDLHPVAILLVLTGGVVVAGIIGALLAVPLAAVVWAVVCYVRDKSEEASGEPPAAGSDSSASEPEPANA